MEDFYKPLYDDVCDRLYAGSFQLGVRNSRIMLAKAYIERGLIGAAVEALTTDDAKFDLMPNKAATVLAAKEQHGNA